MKDRASHFDISVIVNVSKIISCLITLMELTISKIICYLLKLNDVTDSIVEYVNMQTYHLSK